MDLLAAARDGLRDRYAIEGLAGQGGMAIVCRGRELTSGQAVAIKVLHPDLARAVGGRRFLREIAILRRLSHPNIVPLLDADALEVVPGLDVPWYAMPYLGPQTLRARLREAGMLPVAEALRWTRDAALALAHAHAEGIVHRDLKPENLLLHEGRALLADFGIARAYEAAGGEAISTAGLVVGSPVYMSPEQASGSDGVGPASDLYSLGIVLYEMLAGEPPFTGATTQAVMARHRTETPMPIGTIRPEVPRGVVDLVSALLEKRPTERARALRLLDGLTT